jgi:lysophospholipase L1-like esterase
MRTVFIGDSITRDWNVAGVTTGAINSGVGGNRTVDMAVRFWESALAYDPDRIVILGGINDIYWEPTRNIAHIVAMVNRGLRAGAQMYVGTLLANSNWTGYPHVASAAAGNAAIAAFNASILSSAAGYGYTAIDFHPNFVNGDGSPKSQLFADALHLNSAGYAVLTSVAQGVLGS